MSRILGRVCSLSREIAKRLASAPLKIAGQRLRAAAVDGLSTGLVVSSDVPGGTLKFYAPTPLLLDRASGVLTKEPDTIAWIDRFPEGSIVWDVGANVGVYSLYAAARRRCTVLAFEPSASNFFVLTRNVELNALEELVATYCVALSGTTSLGSMNLSSSAMGMAMSQFGRAGETSRYWTGSTHAIHGMVGFTIDEFVERFAPPFPAYIKLDVDGLELPILEGAAQTLADPRLRSVIAELSLTDPAERDRGIELMARAGLKLKSQGARQGDGPEKAANHLFERSP